MVDNEQDKKVRDKEEADLVFNLKMAKRREWLTVKTIPENIIERPLTPDECFSKEALDIAKPKWENKQFGKPIIFGTSGYDTSTSKDFDMLWNNNDEFKYINKPLIEYLGKSIEDEFDNDILKISKFYNPKLLKEMLNFKPDYIMENEQLTEGQKRVRVSFNPNALKRVEDFKQKMADAIDAIGAVEKQVKETPSTLIEGIDMGDFLREVATAKTELQKASMCGVGALTHDATFKYIPNE